jgi:hypothetical protein
LSASQPRCGARFSSPSSPAMKSATFRLDHTPPSGEWASPRLCEHQSGAWAARSINC